MAPTTDDNARDKRSVLRPNPATFLRDFTLYMTTNYAIIWKRCLNYITCLTHIGPASFIKDARFRLKLQKNLVPNGLSEFSPQLVNSNMRVIKLLGVSFITFCNQSTHTDYLPISSNSFIQTAISLHVLYIYGCIDGHCTRLIWIGQRY